MKLPIEAIYFSNIKVNSDARGSGGPFSQKTIEDRHFALFYDSVRLPEFIQAVNKQDHKHFLIPLSSVISACVSPGSFLEHQPLGTHPDLDTLTGIRGKKKSMKRAKAVIAERIQERKETE